MPPTIIDGIAAAQRVLRIVNVPPGFTWVERSAALGDLQRWVDQCRQAGLDEAGDEAPLHRIAVSEK